MIQELKLAMTKEKPFNYIYNWLPLKTSNILDLFVFGKLSLQRNCLYKRSSRI